MRKMRLNSRSLKDALLLNSQHINAQFALRYLQVFVPLRLKTCRLYDKQDLSQPSLFSSLVDQLNPKHPLYLLADKIDWQRFEASFSPLYSADNGRPAKPIRLMCGLLILKHVRNLSDESRWWSNGARTLITSIFAGCLNSRYPFPAMRASWCFSASVSVRMAWN